jgi:hypothetical protein
MPSFSQIWAHLGYDSFPLLFSITLREWNAIGLRDSDLHLR